MEKNDELIQRLIDVGKDIFPSERSEFGFNAKKLANEIKMNHSTLLRWIRKETTPTDRQIEQIERLIWLFTWSDSKPTTTAKEPDEEYVTDFYKAKYEEVLKELIKAKAERDQLKIEYLEKIEKLREQIEEQRKRLDKFPK